MESIIDGITSNLIGKGLDLAMMRHQVIANNIANAETPGFKPLRLDFDAALSDIRQQVKSGASVETIRNSLLSFDNKIEITEDQTTDKVLLDREVTQLVKNTVNYQALISASGEFSAILKMAINGGKR